MSKTGEIRLPVQVDSLDRSYYNVVGTMLTHKDGTERFTTEFNDFVITDLDNPIIYGRHIGRPWSEYRSQDIKEAEKTIAEFISNGQK